MNSIEEKLRTALRVDAERAPDARGSKERFWDSVAVSTPAPRHIWTPVMAGVVAAAIAAGGAVTAYVVSGSEENPSTSSPSSTGDSVGINVGTWKPGDGQHRAIVGGVLQLSDQRCLYAQSGGSMVDIVWPAGYSAKERDDGSVAVIDPQGQVVAATGREFHGAGGAFDPGSDLQCRVGNENDAVLVIEDQLPPLGSGGRR